MRWIVLMAMVVVEVGQGAWASERKFAYTYETVVLGAGELELEPSSTLRMGRSGFFRRFDERVELELGLTDRLQTSLYLNFSATGAGPDGARTSDFTFEGVSSEWKLKLSDPVADAVGSALYLELTLNPLEAEIEGKVILDKRLGSLLLALNLVGEHEWSLEDGGFEVTSLEADVGLAWLINRSWSIGVEARSVNSFGDESSSVVYAGPVMSWAGPRLWATLAVQPQLAALRGATPGGQLDLENHERVEARLLVGAHF